MPKTTILFLTADPSDATRLRLGQEFREIQNRLQLAKLRDQFILHERMSVRLRDITQAIFDTEPQIIHFSGHGTVDGGLCFEDEDGKLQVVQTDALDSLFALISQEIRCVIFNACYSEVQAKEISKHIEFVIGIKGEINDKFSIAFAEGFYKALGAGRSIETSYQFGVVDLKLLNTPEDLMPILVTKKSISNNLNHTQPYNVTEGYIENFHRYEPDSFENTFMQYCGRGLFDQAIRLIKFTAANLIARSEHSILAKLLHKIPDNIIQNDPELLVLWAVAFATEKNFIAEQKLALAKSIFLVQGNNQGSAWADIEFSYVLYLRETFKEALNILHNIDTNVINTLFKAERLHYMMLNLTGLDRFPEAIVCGQEAIELLTGTKNFQLLARVLRHYSNVFVFLGKLNDALVYLAHAREYAKEYDLGIWSFAWIEYDMARIYAALGNFSLATYWVEQAESHLVDQQGTPLTRYLLHIKARIAQGKYDFSLAKEYYTRAGVFDNPNNIYLRFLLTSPNSEERAFTLSTQIVWGGKETDSPVDRARSIVEAGLARSAIKDYDAALPQLQQGATVFESCGAEYLLTSTQVHLANIHLLLGNKQLAIRLLQTAFSVASQNGYCNLEWWQYWTMAKLFVLAIDEQIELEFVEFWAKQRLTTELAQPLYPLVNRPNEIVRSTASNILSFLGGPTELQARQLINECKDIQIHTRLVEWLNDGWLTPLGVIALKEILGGWRRMEIFLLWVCPQLQGQRDAIIAELHARDEFITLNTLKDNIRQIKLHFADLGVALEESGSPGLAYDVAIRRNYLNPKAPIRLTA